MRYAVCKSTYYYSIINDQWQWQSGPDLKEARFAHTTGLIFDKSNNTRYTVVVGGWNGSPMSSVEILEEGSNEWIQGKSRSSFCHYLCLF